ncbi:MAG: transcriptional regulator [Nitrosopumilus sp.]|nr:transcriptional regulator [Nitrosopumilus sp.]
MPGVDLLISRSLSFEIKDNLDSNILQNLEKQLFFEHGMSIKLSIEHFENLHNILKNNLSIDIEAFEKSCVDKIIKVSRTKNNYTVKIIDKKLSEKILDFFGDPETRCILMSLMTKSLTISEILKISNVLKSPAYRKIENLLLNGLILESGKILKNKKRISQYFCVFDKVHVIIKNNELVVEGIINPSIFNQSSITKTGLFSN